VWVGECFLVGAADDRPAPGLEFLGALVVLNLFLGSVVRRVVNFDHQPESWQKEVRKPAEAEEEAGELRAVRHPESCNGLLK
jgi:hypothetical protein